MIGKLAVPPDDKAPKHFYRTTRWELGMLGFVSITFPDPLPPAELEEVEKMVAIWLRGLRRRSALFAEEHPQIPPAVE